MTRPGNRRTVVALLATAGGVNVAYTALIPLVPVLRTELRTSLAVIGFSFTAFALAKSICQLLGGYLVDRFGARRTAVAALLVASVAIFGVASSATGTDLVVWRLVWGVGEGILTPALYRLAAVIATERGISPARLMGWFASAAVAGMAAGPALVGVAGGFLGFRAIFMIAAGATAGNAVVVASLLRVDDGSPDAGPREEEAAAGALRGQNARALRSMLVPIATFGAIDLVNNGLYAALEPLLPITIKTRLGGGLADTSLLFSCGLIVFAVVSGLGGRLVEKVRPVAFAGLAFVLMALCLTVIGNSGQIFSLGLAFTGFMAVQPLVYVVGRRGLSELCGGEARAFGFFGAISDIGFVVGPAIGTVLFSGLGGSAYFALGAISLGVGLTCAAIGRLLPNGLLGRPGRVTEPARR